MSEALTITVKLTPRGGRDAIDGVDEDGTLRVRVQAAPVDGAANRALIRLVADALGLRVGDVRIAGGATARRKRLRIEGLDAAVPAARWPGVDLGR